MKRVVMLLLVVAFLVGTIPLSAVFCEEESVQSGSLTGGEDSGGLGDPAPCGGGQEGGGGGPGPGAK